TGCCASAGSRSRGKSRPSKANFFSRRFGGRPSLRCMRSSPLVIAVALAAGVAVGAFGLGATRSSRSATAPPERAPAVRDPLGLEVRALSAQVASLRDELGRVPRSAAVASAAGVSDRAGPGPDAVETAVQAEARTRAVAVVDTAIASGRFTPTDH